MGNQAACKCDNVCCDASGDEPAVAMVEQSQVLESPKLPPTLPDGPSESLPDGPKVEVEFSAEGETMIVSFLKKPLGMTFSNAQPLAVTKIATGGHAEALGIQIGWEFKTIDGQDVSGMEWKSLVDFFHEQVKALPKAI